VADSFYKEYLASPHWETTRQAAIERAHGECALCGYRYSAKLEVHHRTYVRIGEELPEDLVVLCDECHDNYERGKWLKKKMNQL
jgi:5-methylcytosine-specific restriction endonuclease McrA